MRIAPLFFLSGASGLIYQVLWLRQLGLIFGVTVHAASTVLAAFMAGIAVGSIIGGRLADRVPRPLVWFGLVEIGVGVTALATPWVLAGLQGLYGLAYPGIAESPIGLTAARLVMSFALLLMPTVCMGASLPLIVRATSAGPGDVSRRTGLFYGINTAGAIVGSLAAGLYLIPAVGLQRTYWVAAAANIFVGVVAVAVGRRWAPTSEAGVSPTSGAGPSPAVTSTSAPDAVRNVVLWVFVVSGVATLALEVIWFRVLTLIVRPTVYAFALMLAAVLFGIAAGSAMATPLLRRRWPWVAVLAVVELAMGLAALVSLDALNYSPALYTRLEPWLATWAQMNLAHTVVVAVPAILPASLLMGAAFPIGVHLWTGGETGPRSNAGSKLGIFYGLNVAGAIVGSLAAGFLLLPVLGSRASLIFIAGLIYLSGLVLWVLAPASSARRWAGAALLVVTFGALASRVADPFDAFLQARYPRDTIVHREEAVQSTVSVHQSGNQLSLHLEGNHQANDNPATVRVHRRIGHLAMVLHPDPREALVVGLGGGATAGAVSIHDGVTVDVIELSGAVTRAAAYFRHISYDILARPNVRLRVDDGRNFLAMSGRRYDVITADIILPHHAGANNLYSEEYFQLVRRALKPRGLFLQWVAGTESEYTTIARTFLKVFPNATAWLGGGLLLGSVEPFQFSRNYYDHKLRFPGHRQAFANLGVASFEDLIGMYAAGPDELRAFLGNGPTLSDDRPLVEYFLSLPRDREPDLSRLKGDVRRHLRDD